MVINSAGGRKAKRIFKWLKPLLVLLTVTLVAVGLFYLLWRVYDDRPVTYEDDEAHFKYGSTGGERGWKLQFGFGIPY